MLIFVASRFRSKTKMAQYFEIIGGKKLVGTIDVRGSKNATTPILAATILTKKECILENLPLIEDVFRMIEILESMGAKIKWLEERKISIKNEVIDPRKLDVEKIKKLRSSILLLGSLSARFDGFKLYHPGGCVIGKRPLGTHFEAMRKMGIEISQNEKFYSVNSKKRKATKVVLRELSVTATENAMMLASGMSGKTIIKIAACEPHVEDLGKFLISLGAKIEGLGTHTLKITGSKSLRGAKHKFIPDANEAATFLIMAVATNSSIIINNTREDHLDLVLEKLCEFGADFKISKNSIQVIPAKKLRAVSKIDPRTYPGIPSDVQAPLGVLATQAIGDTLIFDTIFEGRFNYINELARMGARAKILDQHQAVISGPTKLKGKKITSFDLRAGATLIIAALAATGTSVVDNIYQVDRGYETLDLRLSALGAKIERSE